MKIGRCFEQCALSIHPNIRKIDEEEEEKKKKTKRKKKTEGRRKSVVTEISSAYTADINWR